MRRARAPAIASALAVVLVATGALAEPPSERTYGTALFAEVSSGFVPYAKDVPLLFGGGVRFAHVHEVWARGGVMLTGDDRGLGLGVFGYRAALRPGRIVRPILGGFVAGLPETCGHDLQGNPSCTAKALFVFAASAGVRIEPVRWLGLFSEVALGVDTYPNPFAILQAGLTLALPLS
jgi:hypothetical protein